MTKTGTEQWREDLDRSNDPGPLYIPHRDGIREVNIQLYIPPSFWSVPSTVKTQLSFSVPVQANADYFFFFFWFLLKKYHIRNIVLNFAFFLLTMYHKDCSLNHFRPFIFLLQNIYCIDVPWLLCLILYSYLSPTEGNNYIYTVISHIISHL